MHSDWSHDALTSLDRLTEIPESDVYVCESKYVTDDHSLRNLSKPLKVESARDHRIGCIPLPSVENIIVGQSIAR
jgi:hypothetical protein